MMIANVHEAKSQLSKLLDTAERGEEVIITRRGGPRFRIVVEPAIDRARFLGILAGPALPSDAEWAAGDAEVAAAFSSSHVDDEL